MRATCFDMHKQTHSIHATRTHTQTGKNKHHLHIYTPQTHTHNSIEVERKKSKRACVHLSLCDRSQNIIMIIKHGNVIFASSRTAPFGLQF